MEGQADLALVGGSVLTMDREGPRAQAVAVRAGRTVAVGSDDDIRPLVGRKTRLISLQGQTVVPGFQDSHIHAPQGGLRREQCDLGDLPGKEAYLQAIQRYAATHDEPWIVGGGWALDHFPRGTPHRLDLDAVVPDRPAFLKNRDGHGAWVNSKALETAGVTRDTPDPSDGRIERDENGVPLGTLHEGAMDLVERLIPQIDKTRWERAILGAQSYLHSLGITAWQDAWATPDTEAAYRSLAEQRRLTARVRLALWWERDRGLEQVEDLFDRRRDNTIGRIVAGSVKIMQDGVPENFTAGMIDPYLGDDGKPSDRRGLSFVEPSLLNEAVIRLDREGFQVHVHAIGDRAAREALDSFEGAHRANGRRDARHHIAHLQVVHPGDVPRFARLGVVANAQALWACYDDQMRDLCVPYLGPERTSWQYPFGSLVRHGARLAMGSDWPVTTPEPMAQIEVGVTRIPTEARDRDPLNARERIDLETALHAFTAGSAFVNFLDDETGSIEEGKLADIVVLDRDVMAPDATPIGEAKAVLTLVDGEPVHADASIGW